MALTADALGLERVADIQRGRMLAAMAEVCCERGAANVTVAQVVACAGVSRRTFYEIFSDREDCFLVAFDEGVARASEWVAPAYRAVGSWRERVRASLTELLRFLDREPFLGRLLIVESLGAGAKSLERRRRLLAHIISAVDDGRGEARAGAGVTPLTADGIVGAVLSVIHSRLLEGDREPLIGLVNPLMNMVVLPYLGPAAARRELELPVAEAAAHGETVFRSQLRDLDMRLTYRTVRVLMAVAANRGSSNRVIGEASGVSDQGQISKLLSRLGKLGLVENAGVGSARGEPNAWTLTKRGEEVHGAVAAQRSPV
ncbi:MAG TPA: TetR family transcriptional regulator [Solirubrobacteraceae bacterium]|nr:TetR family transcriptional regulator [Solirubrobacteraceae bacterium]